MHFASKHDGLPGCLVSYGACRTEGRHHGSQLVTSEELRERLSLDSIDYYVARRQLRWLGHVSQMNFETRIQELRAAAAARGACCLSSWVPHKRPAGAPRFTLGRTMATYFPFPASRSLARPTRSRGCCARLW